MKLYHCSQSRSTRVLWLLEELDLDYELEVLPFDPKALQAPDYLQINPFGKVPVLVDGVVTLSESVAIVQYILDRYANGRLIPNPETPEYGRYLQWLHFGESTLMGPILEYAAHTRFLPIAERNPAAAERAKRTFNSYTSILDRVLTDRAYLVGPDFTAADIVTGYTVNLADRLKQIPADTLHLRSYLERLRSRPAFKTAMA